MSEHPVDNEPTVVELKTVRGELQKALLEIDRANKLLDILSRLDGAYFPVQDLIGKINRKIGELTP